MAKPPAKRSSSREIQQFLQQSRDITTFVGKNPRLLFAMDATASRQATWDSASHIQQQMFLAADNAAPLAVQLCYYRGFQEFRASGWLNDASEVSSLMASVHCLGGHTQIARLLRHALSEHYKATVRAVVFIGDALEENPDTLCDLAGQCGLKRLPLFLFQEGREGSVKSTFSQMARLSGGAFAHFDNNSASTLAELLRAVACYASGGRKALEGNPAQVAKMLLRQLP